MSVQNVSTLATSPFIISSTVKSLLSIDLISKYEAPEIFNVISKMDQLAYIYQRFHKNIHSDFHSCHLQI